MSWNPSSPLARPSWELLQRGVLLAAAWLPIAGHAIDFGPDGMFSLTGFAEVSAGLSSNTCNNCQRFPSERKQRIWADELVQGAEFKTSGTTFTQIQPYLGFKYDLGRGYKVSGLLSQRWRDGSVDVEGFWYDKNLAISHEDYGSVRIGAMTTRAWSVADYPYGTFVGIARSWPSSGAGYGMLAGAIRYTSRILDVADGDLVLEATYDAGNTNFKINKPEFWELYAQYHKGDLVVDAIAQETRNGTPSAWAHGPFTGLTPFPTDDPLLKGSDQGIVMVMARYQMDSQIEVSGGIRRNRWSGANAVLTQGNQWNEMFNVDWNGTRNGIANPGYPATSIDISLGMRYRTGPWTASTGLVYLGTADTANPSERGQSNATLINTVGLKYDYGRGLEFNAQAGMVHYRRLGLATLSAADNASFTTVDSRVTDQGNWVSVGMVYTF